METWAVGMLLLGGWAFGQPVLDSNQDPSVELVRWSSRQGSGRGESAELVIRASDRRLQAWVKLGKVDGCPDDVVLPSPPMGQGSRGFAPPRATVQVGSGPAREKNLRCGYFGWGALRFDYLGELESTVGWFLEHDQLRITHPGRDGRGVVDVFDLRGLREGLEEACKVLPSGCAHSGSPIGRILTSQDIWGRPPREP